MSRFKAWLIFFFNKLLSPGLFQRQKGLLSHFFPMSPWAKKIQPWTLIHGLGRIGRGAEANDYALGAAVSGHKAANEGIF